MYFIVNLQIVSNDDLQFDNMTKIKIDVHILNSKIRIMFVILKY